MMLWLLMQVDLDSPRIWWDLRTEINTQTNRVITFNGKGI